MNDAPSPSPAPTAAPPASPATRRILALWLPRLATDRLHRLQRGRSWRSATPPDAPLVVTGRVRNAQRLVALDEAAERRGLAHGQSLADARAMIPALEAVEEDPAADAALLAAIADWAERYTPLVALAGRDALLLDITGCAHLFDGEAALRSDLTRRLEAQGFVARAAVADTPGGAIAMARFGEPSVVPSGGVRAVLRELPLAALRLDPDVVAAMDRVGLKRIGQILDAPRAPLAARFGARLLARLDQALGRDEEAIDPRRPAPDFIAERRFAEPIGREEDIAAALASLAGSLAGALEKHGQGGRLFEFSLFRVDGHVARVTVGASRPVRAADIVLDLLREKFAALGDDLDAGFGFDMARLSVLVTAETAAAQVDLAGDAVGEDDLDRLIDRIGARLGPTSVTRMLPHASHVPERAIVARPAAGLAATPASAPSSAAAYAAAATGLAEAAPLDLADPIDRPLRLFGRPEPVEAVAEVPDGPPVRFRWRRVTFRVARAEGPERIAAEWWREDAPTRDYFRVEDADGHRFWLYREGLYGRETSAPRWFLHGVFA